MNSNSTPKGILSSRHINKKSAFLLLITVFSVILILPVSANNIRHLRIKKHRAHLTLPAFSYNASPKYHVNVPLTPITPTSNGVAAPVYSNSMVNINAGVNNPSGIAVDSTGNIYIADYDNNTIKELPVNGGTPGFLGSDLYHPKGVAVDAAGNVYVADYDLNIVKEILKSNRTSVNLGTGFNELAGVAVDKQGNVYVGDFGNLAVKEILKSNGNTVSIGSGFDYPYQVAVDQAGNVYVADNGNSAIKMMPPGGGTPVTLGTGFNHPQGVAVDVAGNVYVSDSGNGNIVEILAGSGKQVTLISGLTNPGQMAVDRNGTLYFCDPTNNAVEKLIPGGGYYISPALPDGLSINNQTGVISGTPTGVSPATTYTITAYDNSGSASTQITFAVTQLPTIIYTTTSVFTAGTPANAIVPVSHYVDYPGYTSTTTPVGSGFNTPQGLAVDAAGNIYVADEGNAALKKIPVTGGNPVTINLGAGQHVPLGVAVDAGGNIYVADAGNSVIQKIAAGTGTVTAIGSGFSDPYGVAVDAAGNVYEVDYINGSVTEIKADNSSQQVVGSGFSSPFGVAVDGWGNIFVSDRDNHSVKEIIPGNGGPFPIGSNFDYPQGIAVDPTGNIFVTDANGTVTELPSGGGQQVAVGSGYNVPNGPRGVAADGAGNVYVADTYNNAVKLVNPTGGYFISPALPAGLRLNTTNGIIYGTPTVASPAKQYTITAYNAGGSAKTFISIAVNPAAAAPTQQAIHLNFNNTTTSSTNVSWTNGNGSSRAVFVAKINYSIPPNLANATTYTASTSFGTGTQIGNSGWYCVYNGTGSSAAVSNLLAGTTYRVIVVEYNGTAGSENYLTTSGSSPANVTTIMVAPDLQAIHLAFTNTTTNSTTVSWTDGNGTSRAVFAAATSIGIPAVTNATTYTAGTTFGAGTQSTPGWFCVYNGTGSTASVSGLTAGTTYRFIVVEYDGAPGNEMYLSTTGSSPANVTTIQTVPTAQAIHVLFTNTTHTTTTASWTNGNGASRAVFLAKTGNGIPSAVNATTYTANNIFGFGDQSSPGWYCVYNGTGSSVSISGLVGGTTYRLMVVEYDGTPGNQMYLHTSGGSPANVTTTGAVNSLSAVPELFSVNPDAREKAAVVANNILSPNGDGVNDTWTIKNIELYQNNRVTVFNTAGKIVFSKVNYANDWAGTYQGSTLNEGTYYYTIDLGNSSILKGFITVVRDR